MQRRLSIERNLTLLTDFYELTMSNGYHVAGMADKIKIFLFFITNFSLFSYMGTPFTQRVHGCGILIQRVHGWVVFIYNKFPFAP